MIGLAVAFDLGRYHATPWHSHVNDGDVEWPPSPWRVLRGLLAVTLVNADLAGVRADVESAVHRLAQAPPPRYRLPAAATAHTRHYYPSHQYSPSQRGKTDRVIDGFRALDPAAEVEIWWQAVMEPAQRDALDMVAGRLSYLGRSESICTARVLLRDPPERFDAAPATASGGVASGEARELLCVVSEDPIGSLMASIAELRAQRLLQPPGTRLVEYVVNEPSVAPAPSSTKERPTLACLRLRGGGRPGIREAVAVGDVLRRALQSRYGATHGKTSSPVLSGRDGDGPRHDQHRHAHFLSLPRHGGHRIDQLVVWAPEGLGPGEVEAIAGLERITVSREAEPLRVALAALGSEGTLRMPELLGPHSTWMSLTPFGLTRHAKRRRGGVVDGPEDQIRRELALRGLPEPTEVTLYKGPWLQFRRSRPWTSRLEAPRVVGARLQFSAPVGGPIVLGALSHYGLGVFVPAS
jgi:CRISPR-associated protein Csb2